MFYLKHIVMMTIMLCLSACGSSHQYAPVTDINEIILKNTKVSEVKKPFQAIKLTKTIKLSKAVKPIVQPTKPKQIIVKNNKIKFKNNIDMLLSNKIIEPWLWPTKSKIYRPIANGIQIDGYLGAPIYAAKNGKVVYAGNGIRGYGFLVILKHSENYLSIYGNNQILFVKEGEWIKQGQLIARMGKTESNKIALHFEVRKGGEPLDLRRLFS